MATRQLIEQHDELLEACIDAAGGHLFKRTGDGCCAVFAEPVAAIVAAVRAQQALAKGRLPVRMGIHAGPAEAVGDDFYGLTLHRCVWIMGAAHGRQVLVSAAAAELVAEPLGPDVELVDIGTHELRDLNRLEHLFEVRAAGLVADVGALRTARRAPALPMPRTALVGRTDIVKSIAELVRHERLVTLVGPGGAGKTRLALETALGETTREVAFVDLAMVADPALVVDAVQAAVGMSPSPGHEQALDDAAEFLAHHHLLLVVDNCEHLLLTAGQVVDRLLTTCRQVNVLATSRQPLGIDGEQVVRVGPLDEGDARELFVIRARSAGADIPLGVDAVDAVDAVLGRLDGLPLAVELAAAQTSRFSVDVLRDLSFSDLDELSSATGRGSRHRSLHALLDWSFALLDEPERAMLAQLSVFPGRFSLDGVIAVVGHDGDRIASARRLSALVDRSLVAFEPSGGRYHLLETVRAFAGERLREGGSAHEMAERHHRWVLSTTPGPWFWTFGPASPLEAPDLADLRAALSWAEGCGRHDLVVELAAWAGPLWFRTSRGEEGLRWLRPAERLDRDLPLDLRLAWRTTAVWSSVVNMDRRGEVVLAEALELAPRGHEARPALLYRASVGRCWTDPEGARRLLSEIREEAIDERWTATCEFQEGLSLLLEHRLSEALACFQRAEEHPEWMHPATPACMTAIALHLAGRHLDARVKVAEIERDTQLVWIADAFLKDVVIEFVRLLAAVGAEDLALAGELLRALLALIRYRYPHVPSAWGIGIPAAAVVSAALGDHRTTAALLAGLRRHGLRRRYEGAYNTARVYYGRAMDALGPADGAAAVQEGEAMSLDELIALADVVAARC